MNFTSDPRPFCLTGGIGCGKTAVAKLLAKFSDVLVVDCDALAKEAIIRGTYKEEINRIIGDDVFPGGVAHLRSIAAAIFGDPEKKRALERLLHPPIWKEVDERVKEAGDKVCVVESAIIYETSSEDKFSAVIVAACNREEQVRRLMVDRRMTRSEIESRIEAQLPTFLKESRADIVIRTDCDRHELEKRVVPLYQELKRRKGIL